MVKTKARRFDLLPAHIGNMKIAPRRSNGFTRQKAFGGGFRPLLFKLPVLVGISLRRDCFEGLARNVAVNPLVCVNQHLRNLPPTLLREMIEKIVVHECSYDENGTRRQDIEIYYSFVGKIDLPEA